MAKPAAVEPEYSMDVIEQHLETAPPLAAKVLQSTYSIILTAPDAQQEIAPELRGDVRTDRLALIRADLRAKAPPEDSTGYILLLADHRQLRIRGEVPSLVSKTRIMDTIARQYPTWDIRDDLRVDERLKQPSEGSLLTLRSIPSSEIAKDSPLIAFSDFGKAWAHCLNDQLPLNEEGLKHLGLQQNTRAKLDLQLIIPPTEETPPSALTAHAN